MEKIKEYIKLIGEEVKSSEESSAYEKALDKYFADKELQEALDRFNSMRDEYFAARDKESPNKDEVFNIQKNMQNLYESIMKNNTWTEYTKLSEDFDNYVEKIHTLLNTEIYGEQATGCGGSCSTCSGCH